MPRVADVREVAGVEDAIATGDPRDAARRVHRLLAEGADPTEVVRTAALAAARHFAPALPPPHALLALSVAPGLARWCDPPSLPIAQACALAASEWRRDLLPAAARAVAGDETHLARTFVGAVRAGDADEADAVFSGLLREGEERRLAGDALFEACAQDVGGEGHKLTFAIGSWRLAGALGWTRGATLLRPAVRLAAGTPQDLGEHGASLREVGRSRLDLELAVRNVAPIDQVARNTYDIALGAGPDRVVADLINGLRRGRSPVGYSDLVAATAAERLETNPAALETALFALAVRFAITFSRTSSHVLALLQAGRLVGKMRREAPPEPARIGEPAAGTRELEAAIEAGDAKGAARLALGLAEELEGDALARTLVPLAAREDATADGGHRLLYASWATEFAATAPLVSYASLAALLARGPRSRTVEGALTPS